jgi:hypothetical protein
LYIGKQNPIFDDLQQCERKGIWVVLVAVVSVVAVVAVVVLVVAASGVRAWIFEYWKYTGI